MIKTHQKAEIIWKNLTVTNKKSNENLLNNVNGHVSHSTMTALMGPSGAGKTTLMNTVAGRLASNLETSGDIFINNHLRSDKTWPSLMGYVEQTLNTYEYQTVYETLFFAYKIKFGNALGHEKTEDIILNIISTLGLKAVKNSYISRLSGGEKRRVAIGIELLGDPPILFCDEPTAGLDSYNANNILSILKKLSQNGKTVLVTIHQPSSEMFEMFDRIILMSGGETIFNGSTEKSIEHFKSCGYELPKRTNPTDFYLGLINVNTKTTLDEDESYTRIRNLKKAWKQKEKDVVPVLKEELQPLIEKKILISNFKLLLTRNFLNNLRNVGYLKVKLLQTLFKALIFGCSYSNTGYNVSEIENRLGVIAFIQITLLFGICGPVFNIFPEEKKVIQRERYSGMYSGASAYIAKFIVESILYFFFEIGMAAFVYWNTSMNSNISSFMTFILTIMLLMLCSLTFSLTISTFSPTAKISQVFGSIINTLYMVSSNLFGNTKTMPYLLKIITSFSPMYYCTRIILFSQFETMTFNDESNNKISGINLLKKKGFENINLLVEFMHLLKIILFWGFLGTIGLHLITKSNFSIKNKKRAIEV